LPPLFPVVVSWLGQDPASVVRAGGSVAGVGLVLVPPLAYALVRGLGAGAWAGLAAGLVCLGVPSLDVLGLQIQPDSWNVVGFTAAAAVSAQFLRKGTWPWALALAGVGALVPLVREQGLMVWAMLVGVSILGPGAWWARVTRPLFVLGLACVAPVVVGQGAALPWETLWFTRVGNAMGDTASGQVPGFLVEYVHEPERYQKYLEIFKNQDRGAILLFYAQHAWEKGRWCWAWALTGLCAAPFLWRRNDGLSGALARVLPPWVALAPVLANLFVYSEARHVVVAVPTAVAVLCTVVRPRVIVTWFPAVLGAAWLVLGVREGAGVLSVVQGQAIGVRDLASFGEALCSHVEEGAVGTGPAAAFLFCPLPRHSPRRDQVTAADWKTWCVDAVPRTGGWARVDIGDTHFSVWRFVPELQGDERPCRDAMPPTGIPVRTASPRAIEMSPTCDALPADLAVLVAALPPPEDRTGNGPKHAPLPQAPVQPSSPPPAGPAPRGGEPTSPAPPPRDPRPGLGPGGVRP